MNNNNNKKIAIVGSRDFSNPQLVRDFVNNLEPGTLIVSGGGGIVDNTAEEVALFDNNFPQPVVFRADWNKHGSAAGPIRNSLIVIYADEVVAFWNGKKSKGTFDCVKKFRKQNKKIQIFDSFGKDVSIELFFDFHKKEK